MRTRKSSRATAASPLADRAAAASSAARPARAGSPGKRRPAGPVRVTRRDLAALAPLAPLAPRGPLAPLAPDIEAELAEIARVAGCELIHAEWKGGVLRLVLDRRAATEGGSDGVTLADCEHVAKLASALLDVLDFGNGRYLLEVSSPGLDRQLYRPSDYQRFLGRLARVTYEAADPTQPGGVTRRRTVVARLAEFHAPPLTPSAPSAGSELSGAPGPAGGGALGSVTLVDDRTGERLVLPLADIRQARLEVEL